MKLFYYEMFLTWNLQGNLSILGNSPVNRSWRAFSICFHDSSWFFKTTKLIIPKYKHFKLNNNVSLLYIKWVQTITELQTQKTDITDLNCHSLWNQCKLILKHVHFFSIIEKYKTIHYVHSALTLINIPRHLQVLLDHNDIVQQ